jgi:hypothetical protein
MTGFLLVLYHAFVISLVLAFMFSAVVSVMYLCCVIGLSVTNLLRKSWGHDAR